MVSLHESHHLISIPLCSITQQAAARYEPDFTVIAEQRKCREEEVGKMEGYAITRDCT